MNNSEAFFHLPGLFEFYEFYKVFLPLFYKRRELFYDWAEISSVYGAPGGCIWGGGRVGSGNARTRDVLALMGEYGISSRLTFSNSLLLPEHLSDGHCNGLCEMFAAGNKKNGIIVHSELLLSYLKEKYPSLYFVSSTTKALTDFNELKNELDREDFRFVVPDFRLNKEFGKLNTLSESQKNKLEFLCNECCFYECNERKACYENVSRKNLGENCPDHVCPHTCEHGYRFSQAMKNPAFISAEDIRGLYLPNGFSNFKIEGRELGSALLLEFILYYLTRPECRLEVREEIYLDNTLDLF